MLPESSQKLVGYDMRYQTAQAARRQSLGEGHVWPLGPGKYCDTSDPKSNSSLPLERFGLPMRIRVGIAFA